MQIFIDADACPVKDEVVRVAERHNLPVLLVSNSWMRGPDHPLVQRFTVNNHPDAADDWIAEHITASDVCVTSDIPLASRCLAKGARALSSYGKNWTPDNIGNALAGREIAQHLREIGAHTGGPAPITKADRSRFLSALDTAVQAARRAS